MMMMKDSFGYLKTALLVTASLSLLVACSDKESTPVGLPLESPQVQEQVMVEPEKATEIVAETAVTAALEKVEVAVKEVQEKVVESAAVVKEEVKKSAVAVAGAVESTSKAVAEKSAEATAALGAKIAAKQSAAEPVADRVEMLALAKKSGCLACHSIENKIVGPAWRDVAAKYRGVSNAKAGIITSITTGSSGKWGGTMAMPPNSPRVDDATIATLAGFVLSLE